MTLAVSDELTPSLLSFPLSTAESSKKSQPTPLNSIQAFRELLVLKKWTTPSGKWLIPLPAPAPLDPQERNLLYQTLQEWIDYTFDGEDFSLTEECWIQKIQAQFQTAKIQLRGSKAASLLNLLGRFSPLLEKDSDLKEAWEKVQDKLLPPHSPQDTDWIGEVEGLTKSNIKNRLIQVLSSYLNVKQEIAIQKGFQNLVEAHRTPLIQSDNSFVIATIGNKKKADILIGKLTRYYLFQRDCFYIGLNGTIEKGAYFWQALYDRLFGIVRLEKSHQENFHCFLTAIELKTRGLQVIEEEATLQEISAPYLHLNGKTLAEAFIKKIGSKKSDPFCFLFNLIHCFPRQDLWDLLIPELRKLGTKSFQPLSWQILCIVERDQISWEETAGSIYAAFQKSPLPLPIHLQDNIFLSNNKLDRFFTIENGFRKVEEKGALYNMEASTLLEYWERELLNEEELKRLETLTAIRGKASIQTLSALLNGPFLGAALPLFLKHLKPLPLLEKLQALSKLPDSLPCWALLIQGFKLEDLEQEIDFLQAAPSAPLFKRLISHINWTSSPLLYKPVRIHKWEINGSSAEQLFAEGLKLKDDSLDIFEEILSLLSLSNHPKKLQFIESLLNEAQHLGTLQRTLIPNQELKRLKRWIEIEKKFGSESLRNELLKTLLHYPEHLVALVTRKRDKKEKVKHLPALNEWILKDLRQKGTLIHIADLLLNQATGYGAGLELCANLLSHAAEDERTAMIVTLKDWAKKNAHQATWPELIVKLISSIVKQIRTYDLSPLEKYMMTSFCVSFPFLQSGESFLSWALSVAKAPDLIDSPQELIRLFESVKNANTKTVCAFFRSSGFRSLLSETQKLTCLLSALTALRNSHQEGKTGIESMIAFMTSMDFSLPLDTEEELLQPFNDLIQKAIFIAVAQYKKWGPLYQKLLYSLLWFILNDNSTATPKVDSLRESYLKLRERQSLTKVEASDRTAAFYMRHISTFLLEAAVESQYVSLFIPFLVEHLRALIRQGPLSRHYPLNGLFDLAFVLPELFGENLKSCFSLIVETVDHGFFKKGSKDAALYLLLARVHYTSVMAHHPVDAIEKPSLKNIMLKLFEVLDAKGVVQSEYVHPLGNLIHYLIEEKLLENIEEFFFVINILNKYIFHLLPFINEEAERNSYIKLALELYLKFADRSDFRRPDSPIMREMKAFREKTTRILKVGTLPTEFKSKYTIII